MVTFRNLQKGTGKKNFIILIIFKYIQATPPPTQKPNTTPSVCSCTPRERKENR